MSATELDWWAGHPAVRAAVIFAFFMLLAFVFDRWFAARGAPDRGRVMRGGITQEADTRLRFVRRLVCSCCCWSARSPRCRSSTGLGRVAGSFLASGALVAAIVGFAAR